MKPDVGAEITDLKMDDSDEELFEPEGFEDRMTRVRK